MCGVTGTEVKKGNPPACKPCLEFYRIYNVNDDWQDKKCALKCFISKETRGKCIACRAAKCKTMGLPEYVNKGKQASIQTHKGKNMVDVAAKLINRMDKMEESLPTLLAKNSNDSLQKMAVYLKKEISEQLASSQKTFECIDKKTFTQLEKLTKVVQSSEMATKKAVKVVEEKTDEDRKSNAEKFKLMQGQINEIKTIVQNLAKNSGMNKNMVANLSKLPMVE